MVRTQEVKGGIDVAEHGPPSEQLDEFDRDPRHTAFDQKDMLRLGKKQEFKRVFGFWPTFGFTSIYLATWEYILVSIYAGLVNGGFGGLVYESIGTFLCFSTIVASLAEIQSMAPTSGGNYHWVSEFAPASLQKYLSYATGWLSALGWLCGLAGGTLVMGTLIESMIEVYLPDFAFSRWQMTLLVIAFLIVASLFNTYLARVLPAIETASLVLHTVGFVIIVAVVWALVPNKNSASYVFGQVVNEGGWASVGVSCLVGHTAILYCTLGPDVAVHISEEVRDAGRVIPVCMMWSYIINAVMGFVMLITVLFTVGDLDDALNASSPFVNSFANTGSPGAAFAMTTILAILIFAGNVTSIATTSREVWAFARDGGFPAHHFLAKISYRFNIPMNAVYVTSFCAVILLLINLGSELAFQITISLNLVAFLAAYGLSIACVIWKRIRHEPLPPARWSLGRFGLPINIFAVLYCAFALVMSCFPITAQFSLDEANWAPAMFGGVLALGIGSFVLHGRQVYAGPVIYVEGRRAAGMGLQTTTS